jgi:hypothetical protein
MPFYCLNNISATLKIVGRQPLGRKLHKNDKIKKISK